MKASIVDLRYKMKDILLSLNRNEEVIILYHGKEKGKIIPLYKSRDFKTKNHPFFGMRKNSDVDAIMQDLRGARYSDI